MKRVMFGLGSGLLMLVGLVSAPVLASGPGSVDAAARPQITSRMPGSRIVMRTSDRTIASPQSDPVSDPTASGIDGTTLSASTAARTSKIEVRFHGFPQRVRPAFRAAVRIWERTIVSSVPITVNARWKDLGSSSVLASAGPSEVFIFNGGHVWYPAALAEALCDCGDQSKTTEIDADFNSAFPDWYFGTDGRPGRNKYDFMSVVLHELGHGLGFLSMIDVSGPEAHWGIQHAAETLPSVFDLSVRSGSGATAEQLIDTSRFSNPSAALKTQVTDGSVFFGGAQVRGANSGHGARMYAPATWASGSSISHFDEETYRAGDPNALMTPFIGPGEVAHRTGPLVRALLRDLGWDTATT